MRGGILNRPSLNPWLLLAIALLVRSLTLWYGLSTLVDDPDAYRRLAINWSATGIYGFESATGAVQPTAFRPPLYPWLLSWLVTGDNLSVLGLAALHVGLGVATVWLTWSVAKALRQPHAWLPALAVAVDPILLRASQLVMTETLAAFMAVLAWRLWLVVWPASVGDDGRSRASAQIAESPARRMGQGWLGLMGLAIVFGLSILARPTAAPWVALCVFGVLLLGDRGWPLRLRDSLLISLVVALCLAPWLYRNLVVLGKPIWATTHGGYTLLLANNPLLYRHLQVRGPSRDWDAEPFHAAWAHRLVEEYPLDPSQPDYWFEPVEVSGSPLALDELADDRLAYQAAWATIFRQPGTFLLSAGYRVGWLWAAWPNTGPLAARVAIGGWYIGVFLLFVPGACLAVRRTGLPSWVLPLALVVSLTVIHAVFWSNMRMRAPAVAMVYVAAAEVFSLRRKG